jgi:copper(I)-binding protein
VERIKPLGNLNADQNHQNVQGELSAVSRSLRRGAVAAVIAVAIAPVLAACSAGSSAATLEVKPNSAATSINGGQLKLNGVAVVTDANGNAPASVIASIANNQQQDENLVSVTVGTTAATLSGPTVIHTGGALSLGNPGPSATTAIVPTLDQPAGAVVPITFVFANSGSVTLQAQIQTGTGQYALYAPKPTPTVAVTPSALPTGTGLPTGAALPTASGSAAAHVTKKPGETTKASPSASATH